MRGARDTIVAVASPPGRGLRAVIRVSGPAARDIARRAFGVVPAVRGASRVRLRVAVRGDRGERDDRGTPVASVADVAQDACGDRGERDDRGTSVASVAIAAHDTLECPAVLFWMEAPASFTGEDSLELACAGAPALVELIARGLIDHAVAAGHAARHALPGEFAWRAPLEGRLGIDEAEGLAARIAATSDAASSGVVDQTIEHQSCLPSRDSGRNASGPSSVKRCQAVAWCAALQRTLVTIA
jgi:tRNA modification GTPase